MLPIVTMDDLHGVGKPILGRPVGRFATLQPRQRNEVLTQLFELLLEGQLLPTACLACDLTENELRAEMLKDPALDKAINRHIAFAEINLVRTVKAGGQGVSAAKAALEILRRTRDGWQDGGKSLKEQFRDFAENLRARWEGKDDTITMDQAYQTVLLALAHKYG